MGEAGLLRPLALGDVARYCHHAHHRFFAVILRLDKNVVPLPRCCGSAWGTRQSCCTGWRPSTRPPARDPAEDHHGVHGPGSRGTLHRRRYQSGSPVLLNLCVNARDAMPRGGSISITTTSAGYEEIASQFARASAGEYVRVSVADAGVGMDEETKQRIFDPLFATKVRARARGWPWCTRSWRAAAVVSNLGLPKFGG
ncbi:MAG TPA: ATP-binding protein [Spirochaetia bacterium]|nr:ATP-binding protein [Spirochaetia bacterium]